MGYICNSTHILLLPQIKMTQKQGKIYYTAILFIGAFSMLFQILIYRDTIIDVRILIYIIIVFSFITYFIGLKSYKKAYSDVYSDTNLMFTGIIQFVISYGFIFCSIFLTTNYYFRDKNLTIKKYLIVERTTFQGRKYHRNERRPAFYIKYKGVKKELEFSHKYFNDMNSYKTVELETYKGYFGFDIIEDMTLKK